jgi:pimeloyl-ACP methyl ester carboxylesterase
MRELEDLPHDVEHMAAISAPTLMLYGSRTAPHLRRSTTAIAGAIPGARLIELPGQGHGALTTAPDLVANAILEHGDASEGQAASLR